MPSIQPTVLDITKTPDGYQFSLVHPGEPFRGPIQQVWKVPVRHEAIGEFCELISAEIEQANTEGKDESAEEALSQLCGGLLNELLGEKSDPRVHSLRKTLLTLNSQLLIRTDDQQVHWELLTDGTGAEAFLGMRCDVGRSLKTQSVPSAVPRPDTHFRCLLIANPNDGEPFWDVPEATDEATELKKWLENRKVECDDFLFGEDATFRAVLQKIAGNTYDIIHYAGHVVFDQTSKEYALRLRDGKLFTASTIRKQLKGAPLVFLNSCWSCKSDGATRNWSGGVEGLTNAFIEAGAQLVVGSLFEIPDAGSRCFAEKFYECVLDHKSVGEAMRLARHYVRGKPQCGATWASFVLYGDPCLKIEVRVDRLSKALEGASLCREDFEAGCLRIVEQAIEYASGNGGVATAHLFAALVGGEKTHLRDTLEQMGAPPEALVEAFRHLFRSFGSTPTELEPIEFSPNVGAILRKARELARNAGRARTAELDVVEAFAQHGGGSVGQVLSTIGIDLSALAPGYVGRRSKLSHPKRVGPLVDEVGPLKRENCTEATWQVLADAALLAGELAEPLLGTPQLFAAMQRDEAGPLAAAFRRFGFALPPITGKVEWSPPGEKARDVQCSTNAVSILSKAKILASNRNQDRVTCNDLLQALLQDQGGTVGRILRERLHFIPDILLTALFDETGRLVTDKLDQGTQRCLQKAMDCAQKKDHPGLRRLHLLYGMLADANGQFASLVRSTGIDAGKLADLLFVQLPSASQITDTPVALVARSMSQGLLRLLRAAEVRAQTFGDGRVDENHLILAVLADGCGDGGTFMIANGVNWGKLTALAEQGPTRQLH